MEIKSNLMSLDAPYKIDNRSKFHKIWLYYIFRQAWRCKFRIGIFAYIKNGRRLKIMIDKFKIWHVQYHRDKSNIYATIGVEPNHGDVVRIQNSTITDFYYP